MLWKKTYMKLWFGYLLMKLGDVSLKKVKPWKVSDAFFVEPFFCFPGQA